MQTNNTNKNIAMNNAARRATDARFNIGYGVFALTTLSYVIYAIATIAG